MPSKKNEVESLAKLSFCGVVGISYVKVFSLMTNRIIIVLATVLLCALGAFWAFHGERVPERDGPGEAPKVKVRPDKGVPKARRSVTRIEKAGRRNGAAVQDPKKVKREKPAFVLDDDDESNLTEAQRSIIEAIRAALDDNNKKEVLKLVQKLQKSPEWPDGIPKSIKMAAIEALGWFGASCLSELAGFLADGDPEVVESAVDKYSEMLSDIELSDYERSNILVAASKIIDDPDAMESMLFELNNMRHSVAIDTIKKLMAEGNAATKSVLPDNVEFFTGEANMDSPEKLDEWLKQNPDDEGDEEFYGGSSGAKDSKGTGASSKAESSNKATTPKAITPATN